MEQFLGEHGVGEQARAHLQDRGEQTDNWAYQYWFKVGGWMDGWMDGWMNGWMDGWMDGWMNNLKNQTDN